MIGAVEHHTDSRFESLFKINNDKYWQNLIKHYYEQICPCCEKNPTSPSRSHIIPQGVYSRLYPNNGGLMLIDSKTSQEISHEVQQIHLK